MSLLNLSHLKNKYNLNVSKIVHVGAHKGQEVEEYITVFPNVKINLFEPQTNLFKCLKKRFDEENNITLFNFALGSKNDSSYMYISNNEGQSSSLLKPKLHLVEHPEINFYEDNTNYQIKILDELNIQHIDLLNIDTQGYELEVLKGSSKILREDVKYIILEINKKELYEGCPLVNEIDNYLKKYGFIRTDTHYWMDSYSWGDAFYIKKSLINNKKFLYTLIKNKLYSIEPLFKYLIIIRNTVWKIRNKTS